MRLSLRVTDIVSFISQEGRRHHLVYVILVITYWLFLLHQFRFEERMIVHFLLTDRRLLRKRHFAMYNLINRHVRVLIFNRLFGCFLLGVELITFVYLRYLLVRVRIDANVVLQTHLHMLHPPVQITDVSYLFLLLLDVTHLRYQLPLVRLQLYFRTKNRQLHNLLQVHIAISVDLYLKVVRSLVALIVCLLTSLLRHIVRRCLLFPLLRPSYLARYQKVSVPLLL